MGTDLPDPRILVVDDDAAILVALERGLRLEGFDVEIANCGRIALERIAEGRFAAVVLDVVMPDISGVEVASRLRASGFDAPICMLSARDEVEDRIAGLRAGADDYLVKPFALEELVLRLRALLRRAGLTGTAVVEVGLLALDAAARTARVGDREVDLTRREFDLLTEFARHAGMVLSRSQLLERVWGYDFEADGNVVDVFVGYLRRKLEAGGEPRMLKTVRGVGFTLRP